MQNWWPEHILEDGLKVKQFAQLWAYSNKSGIGYLHYITNKAYGKHRKYDSIFSSRSLA